MEVFILVGLIILNGLFAMSEIAVVTAKKARLAAMAAKGKASASAALKLAEDPTQFLSAVQIGITSIGIMNGIFGESVLAEPFSKWLQEMGLNASASAPTATFLVVVVVTYVSIVVGELVPKRIGQMSAETIACLVAPPMTLIAIVTKPIVVLLSYSTHGLMNVFRMKESDDQAVTEEDIQALLKEGSASGVIKHDEHAMLTNVLRLDERPITTLMVHRSDIIFLDVSLPLEENYRRMMASPHATFPVCEGSVDKLLGVVSAKDLLTYAIRGEPLDLSAAAVPSSCVLETLNGLELLDYFKTSTAPMVFVIDEYGDIQGIVTLHDLLEAMTGEFNEDMDDAWIVRREDGSLLLDGLLPILDLKDCLAISELDEEGNYQTLNGLILKKLDRLPKTAEKIELQGWLLEIVDMDGHRVDKVLAYPDPNQRRRDDTG